MVQLSVILYCIQVILGVGGGELICFRCVSQDLVPQEEFVGLYEVPGTTGKQVAKLAIDVLLRLHMRSDI